MNRALWLGVLLAAQASIACGPSFDPPSEVKSLRVLGVQKDKPYAKPGDTVTLSMLWHDGSADAPRAVQTAWISGCFNPQGDLYYDCFRLFAQDPSQITLGMGDVFSFALPGDLIETHGLAAGQALYGLSFVFFAACAGELALAPEITEGVPLRCSDADGNALGADDFVVGYSAIYAFEEFTNQNPIVNGFRFRGKDVTPDCIGADCIGLPITPTDCSLPAAPCVPTCKDDGDPTCPDYAVEALVDPSSVEPDEVSAQTYGSDFDEQIWTSYYVDHGDVSPSVKLVNDAVKHWNAKQAAKFYAPKDPDTIAIWAVVHDNRGGAEFVRFTFGAE